MPTRTSTSDSTDVPTPSAAADWISLHVFYAGDAGPLLTGWVGPTVRRLRDEDRLAGWFFIRYWLEGPHVRLRLRPSTNVATGALRTELEAGLADFLTRHPAPELPVVGTAEQHRALYLAEYDQRSWDQRYGRTGRMPVRPNNSWLHAAYEPEYGRYGGPGGIRVAEWHFEKSSDTAIRLLASGTLRHGTRLGLSVAHAATLVATFLDDPDARLDFLARYRDSWDGTYSAGADLRRQYENAYRRAAERLRPRVDGVLATVRHAAAAPSAEGWAAHCRCLRRRVTALVEAGEYEPDVHDPATALRDLLPSYLHMTNNRLGVNVLDEAYTAHLFRSALLDLAHQSDDR